MTKRTPLPLNLIVDKIENESISFARYGDGEFNCMMGKSGHTGGGWTYTKEMGDALFESLNVGTFFHCLNIKAKEVFAEEWLETKQTSVDWYQEDTILRASLNGELLSFVEVIRKYRDNVAIVTGNPNLSRFKAFPKAKLFLLLPQRYQLKELFRADSAIREWLDYKIVLFSCGPLANVYISKMSQIKQSTTSLLDIGSTWDMYTGNLSRGYSRPIPHKKIFELGKLNFDMDVSGWFPKHK